MKKTIFTYAILASLLVFCSSNLSAQLDYKSAAGLRFDKVVGGTSGISPTYKLFLGDKFAVEGIGSLRFGDASSFGLSLLGEIHNEIGFDGLMWYAGAGVGMVIANNSTDMSVLGVVGLEYSFDAIPFCILIDTFPTIRFKPDFDVDFPLSIGIRYILSE